MSLTTIALYEITVHKKNQSLKDTEILSDFNNGYDLLDLIKTLPTLLNDGTTTSALFDDEENSKRLTINTKEFHPFGRLIDGELETGEYGVESNLIGAKGSNKGKLEKGTSPMKPFYFLCDIAKNEKRGYLLLQRFKQFGVFTMFAKAVRQEFLRKHPDYVIAFNPLVSKKELNRVIESATIKKVSFKADNPKQYQNSIHIKNANDQFDFGDAYLEVNLVAKRNRSINLINSVKQLITGSSSQPSDFFNIADIHYNKLKVVFDLNGRTFTIDTEKPSNFTPDIDISSQVQINSRTGLPDLNDIKKASLNILNEIKGEIKNN